jgi:hypothetical protein
MTNANQGSVIEQLVAALNQQGTANRLALESLSADAHADALKRAGVAAQPLSADADDDFTHGDIIAAARSPRGFRRSGVFVPPEKTIIPGGTFKNRAAFDSFMNEPNILAVEKAPKKLADGASPAIVGTHTGAPPVRSTAIMGGATENATPEMLAAAERGELISHPSLGAGLTPGGTPTPQIVQSGAQEIEKVKLERSARSAPGEDGEEPDLSTRAAQIRGQLDEQAAGKKGADAPIGTPQAKSTK